MNHGNVGKLSPVQVPWGIYLLALVPPLLAAVAMLASYDSIPDPMPTHWGLSGEPDSWRDKSVAGVLALVLVGPVVCVFVGAAAAGFMRMYSGTLTEPGGPKGRTNVLRSWHELDVMQPVMAWWVVAMSLSLTVTFIGLSGPWEWAGGGVWSALGLVGVLVSTIWLCVEMGRRADAVAKTYPHPDGRRRRWVLFMEAPDSDRVLVDTGSGSNFTFNVATKGGRIGAAIMSLVLTGTVVLVLAMAVASLL